MICRTYDAEGKCLTICHDLATALADNKRLRAEIHQYESVIIPSWKREEEDSRQTEAEAIRLLSDALDVLKDRRRTKHADDCPRSRDDYDCTCGLSDLCARIEGWLGPGEACTRCGAIGWHQCTSEPLYLVPAPDGSRVLVVNEAGKRGRK